MDCAVNSVVASLSVRSNRSWVNWWEVNSEWARLPEASPAAVMAVTRLNPTNTASEAARCCLW